MAAGGGSGPTRGAYFPLVFATPSLATPTTSAGFTIGAWTVPTGAELGIVDIQAYSGYSGSNGTGPARVNVFYGGTSMLSSEISLATQSSVAGTLATPLLRVQSGQTITATGTGGVTGSIRQADAVLVTVTAYWAKHPNSVFGNFGTATRPDQPNFGI